MSQRYSTAFSHIILAGTGIYCLSRYHERGGGLPCGAYMIIIANSIMGIWYWGNPDYGAKVRRPYHFTGVLQNICCFPLVASQILLKLGYQRELALFPACASIVPVLLYITNGSYGELNESLILIDTVALGVISFISDEFYGMATTLSYAINHFLLKDGGLDFEDVPTLDLYNYGLCFFCYFALRGL